MVQMSYYQIDYFAFLKLKNTMIANKSKTRICQNIDRKQLIKVVRKNQWK